MLAIPCSNLQCAAISLLQPPASDCRHVTAGYCRFLQGYCRVTAGYCKLLQVIAGYCRLLQVTAGAWMIPESFQDPAVTCSNLQ
jgi:hypothetical protein